MTTVLVTTTLTLMPAAASQASTSTDHLSRPGAPQRLTGEQRAVHPVRAVGVEPSIPARAISRLRVHVNAVRTHKCLSVIRYLQPAAAISPGLRPWAVKLWTARHRVAHKVKSSCDTILHRAGWLCIHPLEGPWTNPNYGGLGLMSAFQRTYGSDFLARYGSAGNWPPEAQMMAAERAYRRSGYSRRFLAQAWPNTYPPCAGRF